MGDSSGMKRLEEKAANKNYHQQQGKTHSVSRDVLTESGPSVFFYWGGGDRHTFFSFGWN